MPNDRARKIASIYADKLTENDIPLSAMYLFGSNARGTERDDSDIDIAVISTWFGNGEDSKRLKLRQLRRDVDISIEPHGYTPSDFANDNDPLVYEIKKYGFRIV